MSRRRAASKKTQKPLVLKLPERVTAAENGLHANPVDIEAIREATRGRGGLVERRLRKEAWPKLLGINVFRVNEYTGPPLESHHDYRQVKLDVDRSLRRFPSSLTEDQVAKMQEDLTNLILRLLHENPDIHYYQGLHDIVVTFMLEVGARMAYSIMAVLVHHHIRDFMDSDMQRTMKLISFLPALLSLVDREVAEFIARSTCNYYFCLSCLITWYSHDVEDHAVVARLADLFLATHPMMPLYLSAAIIVQRREEVLSVECELSAVHSLLVHLPPDLDWERAVEEALLLFAAHPPNKVARGQKLSYRRSTTFNCYRRIQQSTKMLLPDHILRINPYADQESLLLLPWRERRRVVNTLLVLSPILISVVYWWWNNTSRT